MTRTLIGTVCSEEQAEELNRELDRHIEGEPVMRRATRARRTQMETDKVTLWQAFHSIREATDDELKREMLEMGNVSRIVLLKDLRRTIDVMREESNRLASIELREFVAKKQVKDTKRRDGIALVKLGITE